MRLIGILSRPLLAAGLVLGSPMALPAAPDEATTRWIGQVLLGSEFNSKSRSCSHWLRRPTLSTIGATPEQETAVEETVAHLNEVLAHTSIRGIELDRSGNLDAGIVVRFAPLAELPEIARRHSFTFTSGNWGYFHTASRSNAEIKRAVVLIASDKLEGELLQHYLLEEITQCLGPRNDSPIFEDSIFNTSSRKTGNPVRLSARDRVLLIFLYRHVRVGTNAEKLLELIGRHWDSVAAEFSDSPSES